jgi:hypothetical protein
MVEADELDAALAELEIVCRQRKAAEDDHSWMAAEKLSRREAEVAARIRAINASLKEQRPASDDEVIALAVQELRGLPDAVRARIIDGATRLIH